MGWEEAGQGGQVAVRRVGKEGQQENGRAANGDTPAHNGVHALQIGLAAQQNVKIVLVLVCHISRLVLLSTECFPAFVSVEMVAKGVGRRLPP